MTRATPNPTEDVEIFANQCVFMRSIYLHHRILFEVSTADEKDSMSRAANIFFSDLSRVLIEYMILQVCKITDPAKDVRKNDNHTVAFLLQRYDFTAEPTTSKRLSGLHDKLLAFREKLLPARNKFISHSDRDAVMAGVALGGATEKDWDQFWLDLQDLVCIIHDKIVGGPQFYINGVAMLSDAHGLLKALKHSDCFNLLLNSNDPEISRKCADLALG